MASQIRRGTKARSTKSTPLTLADADLVRRFGASPQTERYPGELVARLLAVHSSDPDRALGHRDAALFMLTGVASTLDTLGAALLEEDTDTDERRHGECLWFLSKSTRRATALLVAHEPPPTSNQAPVAYTIERQGAQ